MKYILDRDYAKELIEWAYAQNPGPWYQHSINVKKQLKTSWNEIKMDMHLMLI